MKILDPLRRGGVQRAQGLESNSRTKTDLCGDTVIPKGSSSNKLL